MLRAPSIFPAEFVGLVAHELRSPLTVIIGALRTVLSEEGRLSRTEQRRLIQDSVWEAESLSEMISNLLDLSRDQAGRLALHVESVDLSQLIRHVVGKVAARYPLYRFVIHVPRELPPAPADRLKLERVLANLLENAVKYSPGVRRITITVQTENDWVKIAVRDRGIGISLEDQSRLFRSFERLGGHLTEGIPGCGLGLLVCRRLVEAHQGRIWVESTPGHGSTFYFTLPLSLKEVRLAGAAGEQR